MSVLLGVRAYIHAYIGPGVCVTRENQKGKKVEKVEKVEKEDWNMFQIFWWDDFHLRPCTT